MAPSNKHPSNPNAPLYGKMPKLNIPSGIFDAGLPTAAFESDCFRTEENISYAGEVFEKVRVNGKDKVLFESEEEFLRELDDALFHYELFRPCVMPDESGELNDQREYFEQLQKAVSSFNIVLADMTESQSRRLAHAGFVLPQHLTDEGLDNDFIKQSKRLEEVTVKVRKSLKGKNSGKNAELYLLIEQLIEMYKKCTGKKPTIANATYVDKPKGSFFDLVKATYPLVDLSNKKSITDNSIIDGIKLVQKS